MNQFTFFLLICFLVNVGYGIAQNPIVFLNTDRKDLAFGSLEIRNLPEKHVQIFQNKQNISQAEWQKLFWVKTLPTREDKPAVLGTYSFDQNRIRFSPRFAFVDDLSYLAHFDLDYFYQITEIENPFPAHILLNFSMSEFTDLVHPEVLAVHPASTEIPENQLKLYIQFSAPMSKGKIFQYIHWLDESGQEIKPFLEIQSELWDETQTRLTLWFDPGRIKRGLRPHKEMGIPLETGKNYTLKIDKEWSSHQGIHLQKGFQKKFNVIAADRNQPDPRYWKLVIPQSKSKDAFLIHFSESLDYALSTKLIRILDANGLALEGKVFVNDLATIWQFTPEHIWEKGEYILRVHTRLEDLAGNSLRRLFDLADRQNSENQLNIESVDMKIQIK